MLVLLAAAVQCSNAAGEEPVPAHLPVQTDASGIETCTNDLGWTVELSRLRIAVANLEFTIGGETHASLPQKLLGWLVPEAMAHPGHYAGGEVTGELRGDFLLDLPAHAGTTLGSATLLPGDYRGVNLSFRRAGKADAADDDDPLRGHTAHLAGVATRQSQTIEFEAVLDVDEATPMVGGTFDLAVTEESTDRLGLTAFTIDPSEGDSLFDGIDFAELDAHGDGQVLIAPGSASHNVMRKTLVRHDHWGVEVLEP